MKVKMDSKNLQPNLQPTCNKLATDCISRQEAIEAVCKAGCGSGFCGVECDEVLALRNLPPAQPEHDENDLDFVQTHKRIPVQLVVSSDCISREDAIECLERLSACDEPFVEIGTDDETFIGRYEAITEISHLPPAQPYTEAEIQKMQDLYQAEIDKAFELGQEDARSEIIHCGECIHAMKDELFGGLWCGGKTVTNYHYCGYAERRTDA